MHTQQPLYCAQTNSMLYIHKTHGMHAQTLACTQGHNQELNYSEAVARAREARRKIFQLWMRSAKDVWERDYKLQSGNETSAISRGYVRKARDRNVANSSKFIICRFSTCILVSAPTLTAFKTNLNCYM